MLSRSGYGDRRYVPDYAIVIQIEGSMLTPAPPQRLTCERRCYAMTDEQIAEIYALAREAFIGGQQ